MGNHSADTNLLLYLAGTVCNGNASGSDLIQLDSILLSDEVARGQYWDYCRLHVAVRLQLRARRSVRKAQQQIGLPNAALSDTISHIVQQVTHTLLGSTVVAAGFVLLIASLFQVFHPGQIKEHVAKNALPPTLVEPRGEIVGQITGVVNCRRENSSEFVDQGSDTSNQELQIRNQKSLVALGDKFALSSGLMEITYNTGARVILQGPVTYVVESANGGYLSVGKLVGKVTVARARGFCVRTPTAVVTDLGTEFGLDVSANGTTDTDVRKGSVDVVARDGVGHVRLTAATPQNAARVESGSREVVVLDASPARFVEATPQQPRTIGSPMLRRPFTDDGKGFLFVCTDQSFPINGVVTDFSFYARNDSVSPRSITPLIFAREDAGRLVLTGIGQSVTSTRQGIQQSPFRLVVGSAKVRAGKYTFGYFDGCVASDATGNVKIVSRNSGIVCYQQDNGPWRYSACYCKFTLPIKVGSVFLVDSTHNGDGTWEAPYQLGGTVSRTYSAQMTVREERSEKP